MIIVKIQGGLGNQLFQFAYGVYLASKFRKPLKLDLSWYNSDSIRGRDTPRCFDLYYLFNDLQVASDKDIHQSVGNYAMQLLWRYTSKLGLQLNKKYLLESEAFSFKQLNEGEIRFPLYADGYWQNYNYTDALLNKYKLTIFKSLGTIHYIHNDLIPVAVHVRRGDYINNHTHPTLSNNFYSTALDMLSSLINSEFKLLIFSDDIEWCTNQHQLWMNYSEKYFVTEGSHIDQFKMMMQCKHFILANSSFSWWAARLAYNPGNIVICPNNWIQLPTFKSHNLFPPEWISI